MIRTIHYNSPVGRLLLAEKDDALVGLWLEGQKYFLGSIKEEMTECSGSWMLDQAKQWLDRYFAGENPSVSQLRLNPEGSEFRRQVWKILCSIPYGRLTTYKEIGRQIAADRSLPSMSAQAVGNAVGHNPISIIIPCHRVVGSNGSLTGYAGGIENKIRLLALEGVDTGTLFVPGKKQTMQKQRMQKQKSSCKKSMK